MNFLNVLLRKFIKFFIIIFCQLIFFKYKKKKKKKKKNFNTSNISIIKKFKLICILTKFLKFPRASYYLPLLSKA